jgi:NADH dehydrogenase FAD-containing subunit
MACRVLESKETTCCRRYIGSEWIQNHFLFKPNTIYIPFGLDSNKLKLALKEPAARKNISFVQARAQEVDPISKKFKAGSRPR